MTDSQSGDSERNPTERLPAALSDDQSSRDSSDPSSSGQERLPHTSTAPTHPEQDSLLPQIAPRLVEQHFSDLDVYGDLISEQTDIPGDPDRDVHAESIQSSRINWLLLIPWIAIFVVGACYVFVMPSIEHSMRVWWNPKKARGELIMESPQLEIFRTCEFVTVLWVLYFGASIGSFFNVVAGRLPQGRGIVFGGSKCPRCNNKLRFIHNTPLIGWLWCRGRCAFCKTPIPFRYLWMELLTGFLFLLIANVQLFSGGANLPRWQILPYTGIVYTVFYPKWLLIGAVALHAFLFASIAMLMAANLENAKFPWKAWLVFTASHLLLRTIGGESYGLRWGDGVLSNTFLREISLPLSVALTLGLGAIAGFLLGLATSRLLPKNLSHCTPQHWLQASFLIGCVLGWQAVLIIVLVAIGLVRLTAWLTSSRWKKSSWQTYSTFGILLLVAMTHHFAWRQLGILFGIRL